MAALRKPKRPILGALEEGDELEPAEPPTTAGTPPMEKKRLQLTIKNVLLRAQVTRLFTDKPVNSIVPEIPSSIPLHTPSSIKLAPIAAPPQRPSAVPSPAAPPPLIFNHTVSQNGNIWSSVVRKAMLKAPQEVNGSSSMADMESSNQETSSEGGSTNDDDHGAAVEARKKEASQPDYGRNLVLAESCRAAFCRDAENRSTSDLQALRTWFQKTKLKTCTDFESLQAMELTLLCRRMKLHAYYPNEVVFKQVLFILEIGHRWVLLNTHDTYIKILKKKPSTRSKTDLVTLATFLQTLKFFRGLPKTFVQELCTIIDLINVDANTTIFREGEIGKLFYVILSGAVDVKISAVDQRGGTVQTKLVNLGEGSHFGDLALMKKDGLRSATVVSTHSCELLIIAEKDYNSILKKLQKEDMQKRMALLDKIPIFQSVEWTSELMQELSYVLMEQRLAAGTALYKQAVHLYFLTRGEVILSKSVVDPKSHKEHLVVVDRLGPFNVLGDDAYVLYCGFAI
ncbi:hypothetical protein DYB36_005708 [Aphanomyces astaci]|uniref:Cyclic nucleotide-binding domain-containing protein n=1 Tax=Aphanomyces astaci TaxID=112090 RepID=A0A397B2W7_APHAT|nr:hypothetical protein DYB36_005708 [Aphanomyces astaci]